MATKLILIRHGITDWNRQKRYCGYKDVGLSSKGKAQAAWLCQKLKSVNFDRIYSSDRKRALQTARIMFNEARLTKVKSLREINFGVLEGLRHKEIMKKYADVYEKWLADPLRHCIPKAEPVTAFRKRVNSAIKKIVRFNHNNTVAVVCHGGVIGIFISSILKSKNFWRYIPDATSITVVEYKKGKPRIKKFNETAYLR